MVIAITGGGTGGHLSIAKALGLACKEQNIQTVYIGGVKGQDREWFEKSDIFTNVFFLDSVPVVNQKGIKKIHAFNKNILQAIQAKKIMKNLGVKACISVGGFCAASGGFGSLFGRIPLFIHEQNAFMGSLNKLLKPFCKMFFSSFTFPNSIIMPYPTNAIFFQTQRIRKHLDSMLFLGGSQGAKAINDFALAIAKNLHEKGIRIIHQTGRADFNRVETAYRELGFVTQSLSSFVNHIDSVLQTNPQSSIFDTQGALQKEVILFDFSENLSSIMAMSDFCISRAGASSLWELTSNGLPTLFVPYPYAAKNHQYFNAKFLSDKDCAKMYSEEEIKEYCKTSASKEKLLAEIFSIPLEKYSRDLIHCAQKDGAKEIVAKVIESLNP
ncbi:UDP-N-acetylglucosamine--N-acetylmuramyl-(pentapeptide) pyrophosphoryl-undecaprenol N-acetylglucosamine transferase [Helicobacter aurati]|uniref:UDP-N-acetylglucosamine--N-acetylmuramyl-(pentapeptide) pyrophosphoryl-undecaprenol N-acetylglucosamine transferase n=1 Tax=Helicobacter aurati TaxID=137778 RepID=A0A3D8J6N1_9HELI|nr:UDP-N-acetylglucosamine--N-acetylmuramyl-(pentapeptide) pyrophosphoryl-undecaprenol N-acetylglucosamine transferase [Helicobacter aurati]